MVVGQNEEACHDLWGIVQADVLKQIVIAADEIGIRSSYGYMVSPQRTESVLNRKFLYLSALAKEYLNNNEYMHGIMRIRFIG